jgi:hypothetical protein
MEFSKSFAYHPRASCWSSKNTKKPCELSLKEQGSKFWFKCDKCPHEFETMIYTIVKLNTWCPYCCMPVKKLCDDDTCMMCFDKSFASSDKAIYWSSKNELSPRVVTKSCNKKFKFNCNTCKTEFSVSLNNVTNGKWCKKCGYVSMKEKQSMKLDEFIERSKQIHGDTYNYSKVVMKGVDTPVIIICRTHGEFLQTPYHHCSSGNNCPKCAISTRGLTNRYPYDKFIEISKKIYGDKYDYSLVKDKYAGLLGSRVPIICDIHGLFEQTPSAHLLHNCEKCGKTIASEKQRMTNQEFIDRAIIIYGDKYDYSKTKYYKGHTLITITCKIHGDFQQDPYNHLGGTGCKRCTYVCCLEDFLVKAKEIHNNLYDYSLCVYDKSIKLLKIICKECGIFEQSANSHLGGRGCPTCINKTEKKLFLWLKSIFPNIIKEFKPSWCLNLSTGRCLRFDFMIPELKLIIELDGKQHFVQVRNWLCPEQQIRRDVWKMIRANSQGYKVIRVLQDDVYRNNMQWLEDNMRSELIDRDTNMFIGECYDNHIELLSFPDEITSCDFDTDDSE